MTALKVIGIIVLIVLLIGLLRLGAVVSFGDALRVRLMVGPLRLTVYPRKKRRKPKAEKPQEEPSEKPEKKPSKRRKVPKLTLQELLELADTALSALGATVRRACRRVRIDPLELTVVFGGLDPAETAMFYGTANTLMFALMPRLEETFYIPDPSLHLRMDLQEEWPSAEGTVGVSLRVCDLIAIALTLAVPMAKWYLRFRKNHKNDKPVEAEVEAQETEQQATEKQSA